MVIVFGAGRFVESEDFRREEMRSFTVGGASLSVQRERLAVVMKRGVEAEAG